MRFYTARVMAEIHRSRARRPKCETSPREVFDSQERKHFRFRSTKNHQAFLNRLVKRRQCKGYKVGRQGGCIR